MQSCHLRVKDTSREVVDSTILQKALHQLAYSQPEDSLEFFAQHFENISAANEVEKQNAKDGS